MLKKRDGFTLVELVVTIAIAGLIFFAIASFSVLSANLNTTADDLGKSQQYAQLIMQTIEGELRYAKSVDINANMSGSTKENFRYIFLNGGAVYKQVSDYSADFILPTAGFESYSLDIVFSPTNDKVLKVGLSVLKNEKTIYTLSTDIHINNLIFESITGEQQGKCVSYKLADIPVSSIIVDSQASTITQSGQTMQMSANIYPANATLKGVAWSVDKQDSASITQEGLLTPLKNGLIVVTATALDGSGVTGTKQIIIDFPVITITDVVLNTENGFNTLQRYGHQVRIIPNITPADATNQQLTWSVDDPNYATIDQNGVLTSKNSHNKSVMVTATTKDGSGITATIEIRIVK